MQLVCTKRLPRRGSLDHSIPYFPQYAQRAAAGYPCFFGPLLSMSAGGVAWEKLRVYNQSRTTEKGGQGRCGRLFYTLQTGI